MDTTHIDPNNKCGYESIWIALKCKNSYLIDKYNLIEMIDLYKLLRYGSEEFPSLFEEENIKKFMETICPKEFKVHIEDFKNERFYKNKGAIWDCYYLLVAIYFNIEIVLMDKDKNELEDLSNKIKETLNILGLEPNEKIRLHIIPRHVEYLPENNEIEIFKNLKKNIAIKKYNYDDNQIITLIQNTEDDDDDDDDLFTIEELEMDLKKFADKTKI